MANLTGPLSAVVQLAQGGNNAPNTKQPFWDPGGFRPADLASQGQATDPNWEAPITAWSEWDTATITTRDGVLRVPGLVTVSCKHKNRVQSKKAPGAHGANPTQLGFDTAEVTFQLQMWTPAQFRQFALLVDGIRSQILFAMNGASTALDKTNPRKVAAFDVAHPGLAQFHIYSLVFKDYTIPKRTSTPQVYEATISWEEFNPINQAAAPNTIIGATGDIEGVGKFAGQSKAAQSPANTGGSNP